MAFTRESNGAIISDVIFSDGNGTVEAEATDGFITRFTISFERIVQFATGSPSVPPVGFLPTPSLGFNDPAGYTLELGRYCILPYRYIAPKVLQYIDILRYNI